MGTITSANSEFALTVPALGLAQVPIQGYEADDAFSHESFEVTETRMGVDGILSAGFTPNPKKLTVSLKPDSPSIAIFDAWISGQEAAQEAFPASAVIVLKSTGKAYAFSVGWLRGVKKLPDAKKTLQGQSYTIEWQDIQPIPI